MTEKLWMKDSYLQEWDATVEKVKDSKFVVLDKSAFYPEQGGQPFDEGTIVAEGVEFGVVYGKAFGEDVSYEIEPAGLKQGDSVHCVLDWGKRFKLMRMHTAAHVLHHTIFNETGALITGNQLGEGHSRMDFSLENFDRSLLTGFEEKANELLSRNLGITVKFMSREEAMKIPGIVRLMDKMPKAVDKFRIVDIGGIDVTADGGTHVRNTSEVGNLHITKLKNNGVKNRRIYFELD